MEKRAFQIEKIEIRSDDDGQKKIVGHAAVFNTRASGGWFEEEVSPGAFATSIGEDDIRALWNHNSDYVLARNKSGTLRLSEDEKGLAIEIDPPDTSFARDLMASLERGDINQMSFGFEVRKDTWEEREDDLPLRTLQEVKLWEVSPVTFPFYKDTDVATRSDDEWREAEEAKLIKPTYRNKLRRKALKMKAKKYARTERQTARPKDD